MPATGFVLLLLGLWVLLRTVRGGLVEQLTKG
jgi:hypothetical protein